MMNFVVDNLLYCWLIVAFLFLIMEMGSPGLFFFIAFFFGGLLAAVSTFFNESIVIQMAVFFVGTAISLVVLRYCIMPLLGKNRPHERTNVYALSGKRGFVVHAISMEKPGFVKINGEVWVARSSSGERIEKGILVEVVDVRGAHVVVKEV
jgi:membrane protein implicated in regulation of membrane protease activity